MALRDSHQEGLLQTYSYGTKENKQRGFPQKAEPGSEESNSTASAQGLILILTVQQDVIRAVSFSSVPYQMGVF